jgi:hypothetical protein
MTNFLSLFTQSQTIIFDLGNIVDSTYTGLFNVTLTAAFFSADDSITPADLIVPVSSRQGASGQPSHFTTPPDTATNNLTFPQNVRKAVFTVAATGQAEEEVRDLPSVVTTLLTLYSSGGATFHSLRLTRSLRTVHCTVIHRSAKSSCLLMVPWPASPGRSQSFSRVVSYRACGVQWSALTPSILRKMKSTSAHGFHCYVMDSRTISRFAFLAWMTMAKGKRHCQKLPFQIGG